MNHPRPDAREALLLTLCGALGVWIGVHILRTYLVTLIWYVSRDATTTEQIGIVSVGVFAVGLLAGVASRFAGGPRPAWRFGALVVALAIAWRVLPTPITQPALPFAVWIVWLWWFLAFLRAMAQRRAVHLVAPSIVLGLAAQVATQTALHGLDLPHLTGLAGFAGNLALAGAFLICLYVALIRGHEHPGTNQEPIPDARWIALAAGPYLFLQITLLANLGRLQILSDWPLWPVALVAGIAMVLSLLSLRWPLPRVAGPAIGMVALLLLFILGSTADWGVGILAVIPLQIAATALLHAASLTRDRSSERLFYVASAAGWILFLALSYGLYAVDAAATTWAVAIIAIAGASLASTRVTALPDLRPAAFATAVFVAGIVANLGTMNLASSDASSADRDPSDVRVMTYNIHQGFDDQARPTASAIADVIVEANADVIALQELHRGANITGGADLVAYLRWRLPEHQILFAPWYAGMMGNAILSRYPVVDWGSGEYPPGETVLVRGYIWATIVTDSGEILFVSTHLSSSEEPDATRETQAETLVGFWDHRNRSIIAGDINSVPSSAAIETLLESGLVDAMTAPERQDRLASGDGWEDDRIDYIFTSPDILPLQKLVVFSPASDHPAVIVDVRLPDP